MGLVIWQVVMHTIILSRSSFAFWSCLLIINWFRQEWWTLTCDDEQLLSSAFRYCMDYKIIISHRRFKNFLFVCLGYWYSSAVKGKQKTNKQKNRQRNNQTTNCHISDMLPHRPRKGKTNWWVEGRGSHVPNKILFENELLTDNFSPNGNPFV